MLRLIALLLASLLVWDAAAATLTVGGQRVILGGQSILLGGPAGGGTPGGTLALRDMPAGMIVQREAGATSARVHYRVGYSGAAPSAVQVRVLGFRTGAVVTDWSDLVGLSCAAGECIGRLATPQGGPYRFSVRDKYNAGTILDGAGAYGVGELVVHAGQSENAVILSGVFAGSENAAYLAGEPYLVAMYTTLGWSPVDRSAAGAWSGGTVAGGSGDTAYNQNASGYLAFGRKLSAQLGGIPVGIIPRWKGGAAFSEIFEPGGSYYNAFWPDSLAVPAFANQPAGTYGDIAHFVFSQGGTDAGSSFAVASAWGGKLLAFYRRLVLGGGSGVTPWLNGIRGPGQLGFYVEQLKSEDQTWTTLIRDQAAQFVADMQAAGGRKVETLASFVDLPSNGVDLTLGGGSALLPWLPVGRVYQTVLWGAGQASFSGRGATIASVARTSSTTVRITVAHDVGTALTNDTGAGVGASVTGFAFSAAGDLSSPIAPTSVVISGASTVDASFPTALPASVYVGYQRAARVDNTHALYGNEVLPFYNPGPPALGSSGSGSLGLPVRPTPAVLVTP